MLTRRILAFLIDYFLIGLYGLALYQIVIAFRFDTAISDFIGGSPFKGQLVGFFTMTLPVVSYFVWLENSSRNATVGKRITGLRIKVNTPSKTVILRRNVLKFLPWEIAHLGVHWLFYFDNQATGLPVWVWITLITPQVIMLLYFVSAIMSRTGESIYDKISGTRVVSSTDSAPSYE